MTAPTLTRCAPRDPAAVILMLHGGKARGLDPVDERSASWRRSRWMMAHIGGRANRAGAAVWLLRYGVRGWNAGAGADPSPVPDTRWALDQVRREHGDVPVVLLGHSMGARTAVAVADHPGVVGVVGLAPWLPADEPTRTLAGKHLAVAHGASDRITSARASRAFVARADRVASSTEFHDMGRVGHYMFRRVAQWNDFAVSRSLAFVDAAVRSDR
ncbi:MAG: alpha/beta hydrolase [Actinomycetes bacterium]